jgi:TolB protein
MRAPVAPAVARRTLAFVRGDGRRPDHLYAAGADGKALRQIDRSGGCKQDPAWSPDGTRIAYRLLPKCGFTTTQIAIIGADGRHSVNLSRRAGVEGASPCWSRDGRRIVFAGARGAKDRPLGVYVMNANGSHLVRLTPRTYEAQRPTWSPDGTHIAFGAVRNGDFDIYVMRADGSHLRRLTGAGTQDEWPLWSPDSRHVAWDQEGSSSRIMVMDIDGSHKREVRAVRAHHGGVPANWAPGSWIAFNCSNAAGGSIGLCAARPRDNAVTRLVPRLRDASFAAWRPARAS